MSEHTGDATKSSPNGTGAPLVVPTQFTSRRLVSLQVLRGIAALMVVVHHCIHQSPGFLAVWPTEAWQAGVDLFFVISGFVMVYVTNMRERSAKQFLAMRAARIVPVYWFFTLASAVLMLLIPRLYNSNELTVRHLVLSLLFIPHNTESSGWSPLIKQGWTLNYEVFFYILFAIAMAISIRRRTAISAATLVAMAFAGHVMLRMGVSVGILGFYFQQIVLEFVFGMLVATAFLRGKLDNINHSFGALLVAAGFITMFVLQTGELDNRALVYGLPSAAIVAGALAFEQHVPLRMSFLQSVGDASYSIYLVHIFPIAVLRKVWPLPMQGVVSLMLFVLITIVIVLLVGRLSYTQVELRSLRYFRGKIERSIN